MHSSRHIKIIKRISTGLILGALFWTSFAYLPAYCFSILLIAIMFYIILFEWRNFFPVTTLQFWLYLPLYPVLPFLLLIYMNHVVLYRSLLFILFIMVSAHDTGAYIVGVLWGKHIIAPRISSGKTWEGFIGGCIAACGGLSLALWELDSQQSLICIIVFSIGISILSLSGDLFESWLKRKVHIKDSGDILPGHGGFLDRFDGILFTVFFFYFYRAWLISIFF